MNEKPKIPLPVIANISKREKELDDALKRIRRLVDLAKHGHFPAKNFLNHVDAELRYVGR